jgi:hypothetical protein
MSTSEIFCIAWALVMTVLWQLSRARSMKLIRFTYKVAAMVADGKGRFVRTDDDTVIFKEN